MSGRAYDGRPGDARPTVGPGPARFLEALPRLRVYLVVTVLAALVLPVWLRHAGIQQTRNPLAWTFAVVLVLSAGNVELGRWMEGAVHDSPRPHRGLSACVLTAGMLLPPPYLLPVVAVGFGHARWRGLRVPLWRWVALASFMVLAGLAAAAVRRLVMDGQPNLMDGNGGRGLVAVVLAALAFLVVESALLYAGGLLNAEQDAQLRRTLRRPAFHLHEGAVLLMGGLTAAVWDAGAWFMLLLVPVYALAQRSVLNDELRQRVDTDEKTGLLRFETWREMATVEKQRCLERETAWSVVFADLDHFKRYNDTFGHLAGDAALAGIALELRSQLRSRDLVARFGGEEFCVFLPDTPESQAREVGERLRCAIEACELPDTGARCSISLGVVAVEPRDDVPFGDVLSAADRALFRAKTEGRNRVSVQQFRRA